MRNCFGRNLIPTFRPKRVEKGELAKCFSGPANPRTECGTFVGDSAYIASADLLDNQGVNI